MVILGRKRLPKSFLVLETDPFDAGLGEDFFDENLEIPYLGLQSPRHLLVRTDDREWEKVHLEETAEIVEGIKVLRDISFDLDTEVKVEGLLRLEKEMLLTLETYTLATEMKLHGYKELNPAVTISLNSSLITLTQTANSTVGDKATAPGGTVGETWGDGSTCTQTHRSPKWRKS